MKRFGLQFLKFHSLGLNQSLASSIGAIWKQPTEIQKLAIPKILNGQNIVINSETGSGKTLAYLLPMIELDYRTEMIVGKESPLSLIIVPSRHLQYQVLAVLQDLGFQSKSSVIPIPEGIPFVMSRAVSVGVGTPASILQKYGKQRELEQLLINTRLIAIDEADFLLNDSTAVKLIENLSKVRKTRIKRELVAPNFVFSGATFAPTLTKTHKTPRALVSKLFNDIEFVCTDGVDLALSSVDEKFINVDSDNEKFVRLNDFLLNEDPKSQCIIFVSSPQRAEMVSEVLSVESIDWKIDIFHGDIPRDERTKLLLQLIRDKPVDRHIIIATDSLARGADLKYTTQVVHFDFPRIAQDYLHRVGRTLRGPNAKGKSIAFVSEKDRGLSSKLIQLKANPSARTVNELLGFKRIK